MRDDDGNGRRNVLNSCCSSGLDGYRGPTEQLHQGCWHVSLNSDLDHWIFECYRRFTRKASRSSGGERNCDCIRRLVEAVQCLGIVTGGLRITRRARKTAAGGSGKCVCSTRVCEVEHAHDTSLGGRVGRSLRQLALRVQMRSVDCESNSAEQKDTQGQNDKKDRLAGFAFLLSNGYFQNVITPSLLLDRFMAGN
jgi:IS1 family transposase